MDDRNAELSTPMFIVPYTLPAGSISGILTLTSLPDVFSALNVLAFSPANPPGQAVKQTEWSYNIEYSPTNGICRLQLIPFVAESTEEWLVPPDSMRYLYLDIPQVTTQRRLCTLAWYIHAGVASFRAWYPNADGNDRVVCQTSIDVTVSDPNLEYSFEIESTIQADRRRSRRPA
jgi:hypothetical protein